MAATGLRPALWLSLLLCAGSVAAQPATPPQTCRVTGRVFTVRATRDTVPEPFANVSVIEAGTRRGEMTDETGAFVLAGLPAGRIVLIIQAMGRPAVRDTFDLVAGQTIRREYRVGLTPYEEAKDSLMAMGQWPPRLDPGLLEHISKSHDVRVFRIDAYHPVADAPPDEEHRAGRWPITGEAHRPSHHLVSELIEALRVSSYDIPGLYGGPRSLCAGGFRPGVAVRFTREGVPVDVLLCYSCYEISIWREGHGVQVGDFEDKRFVDFAKSMFPNDPAIARLTDPRPGSAPR